MYIFILVLYYAMTVILFSLAVGVIIINYKVMYLCTGKLLHAYIINIPRIICICILCRYTNGAYNRLFLHLCIFHGFVVLMVYNLLSHLHETNPIVQHCPIGRVSIYRFIYICESLLTNI